MSIRHVFIYFALKFLGSCCRYNNFRLFLGLCHGSFVTKTTAFYVGSGPSHLSSLSFVEELISRVEVTWAAGPSIGPTGWPGASLCSSRGAAEREERRPQILGSRWTEATRQVRKQISGGQFISCSLELSSALPALCLRDEELEGALMMRAKLRCGSLQRRLAARRLQAGVHCLRGSASFSFLGLVTLNHLWVWVEMVSVSVQGPKEAAVREKWQQEVDGWGKSTRHPVIQVAQCCIIQTAAGSSVSVQILTPPWTKQSVFSSWNYKDILFYTVCLHPHAGQ